MRLLADENIPGPMVTALRDVGHDVLWIAEAMPSTDDRSVLALAAAEQRVLLTFDKDFGELAFRHGLPASSGVVLLRVPIHPATATAIATRALDSASDFVGRFVVVEEHRIRERPLTVPSE